MEHTTKYLRLAMQIFSITETKEVRLDTQFIPNSTNSSVCVRKVMHFA